ncbi:MAG: ABC transporter ATP-binding protein [Christensenellales bacterium]|jgi:iron complex transport system ATP-binding protein
MMLTAQSLSVRYGERTVLNNVSFDLDAGQWLMVVGPNGAGKSTLLGAIAQSVPYKGKVTVLGQDARHMRARKLARMLGVLAQNHRVGYGFSVEEVVALGRYAHRGHVFAARDPKGEEMVEHALKLTGMDALRKQSVLTLSGGELQRTFLAQVFAQNPDILLLDEPSNHLDLKYQREIYALIAQWLSQPGRAVLSVVHDLSLARKYGTHALLMEAGHAVHQGACHQVLTRDNLQAVYDMDVVGWLKELLSVWAK